MKINRYSVSDQMLQNKILREDIESFTLPDNMKEELNGSVMIITGATGLIGSTIVRCLNELHLAINFILPVRNLNKASKMFEDISDSLTIIETDLTEFFTNLTGKADFIIHCASSTDGKYMSSHPAETFQLPIESTRSILEYARRNDVRGIVYLSSIEFYGQIFSDAPISEEMMGEIDRQSPRSSYALGKQAAEYLGYCYAKEYDVPVKNARLTQTFGAGIAKDDKRVFAQFARSVINSTDIVLHTEGKSAKPYCYTTDCVSAIIYILIKGKNGESYNVSTPGSYVTIREFAELFKGNYNPDIKVTIEKLSDSGYAPDTTVNLNAEKLLSLGWTPRYSLVEMIGRLIEYLRSEQ